MWAADKWISGCDVRILSAGAAAREYGTVDTIPIQMPDGTTIAVRLFAGREAAPVVVIFPGLGVPGGFYDPVAEALVAHGFNAADVVEVAPVLQDPLRPVDA